MVHAGTGVVNNSHELDVSTFGLGILGSSRCVVRLWRLKCTHLEEETINEDIVQHNEAADEEIKGDSRVAVAPEKHHETAETQKHHNLDVQKPLVVLFDIRTVACITV